MRNNYQEFMHAFNELHNVVAEKVNKAPDTHFGELLGTARKKDDKVIETYLTQIDFYREFRNLLTHNTINGKEAVAQPSQSLIAEIKTITNKIKHNKKVKDLFLKDVQSFDAEDSLRKVLEVIHDKHYSQFPVFNKNKLVGIISSIGITNFLSDSIEADVISIKKTTIQDILPSEEEQDFYEVIPANKSIFDIEELFTKRIKEGRTAYLLLIAKDKEINNKNDLIGIITPWDIPKIVANK